jgi:hypothetical protein
VDSANRTVTLAVNSEDQREILLRASAALRSLEEGYFVGDGNVTPYEARIRATHFLAEELDADAPVVHVPLDIADQLIPELTEQLELYASHVIDNANGSRDAYIARVKDLKDLLTRLDEATAELLPAQAAGQVAVPHQ